MIKENKITESKKRKNVEEDESEGIKKPKLEEETPAVARSPRSPVKELLDTKSSPKRKAEDDPSPAKKRAKEGEHTPILIGLCNSGRSCYQNSVLQCLGGFSQLTEALLPRAVDILDRAELRSLTNADLATIRGCQSRRKGNKKSLIREILEQSKEDVYVFPRHSQYSSLT